MRVFFASSFVRLFCMYESIVFGLLSLMEDGIRGSMQRGDSSYPPFLHWQTAEGWTR